jgi:hypothetical protein
LDISTSGLPGLLSLFAASVRSISPPFLPHMPLC